jgi:DNA-binding GntR family transcriptional regulator
VEVQAATDSALAGDDSLAELEAAVMASEQAEQDGDWRAAGTASLRFHQALVALLGSRLLDEFFHSLLAQLRLAWSESWDDEEFQRSWAQRDRELYELLRTGRRTQAIGALLLYLEDSERQVLDVLRRSTAWPRQPARPSWSTSSSSRSGPDAPGRCRPGTCAG